MGRDDVFIQEEEVGTKSGNWMMGIRLPKQESYDEAEAFFREKGIEIRPMFFPITAHQHLVNNKAVIMGDCSVAERLNKECIVLPSFPELTKDERMLILDTLNAYVKEIR